MIANKNGTRHRRGRCGSHGTIVVTSTRKRARQRGPASAFGKTEMDGGFYADLRLRLIMSASPLKPRAKTP